MQAQSLGREDPLENETQPPPVFLPGKCHGQRTLAGYSPWGCQESDMTERLKQQQNLPKETGFISYSSAHLLKIFIWL